MIAGAQRTQHSPFGGFMRAYGSFEGRGNVISAPLLIDPRFDATLFGRSFDAQPFRDFDPTARGRNFDVEPA